MKKLICFFLVFIVFILNADPPYQYFYAFGENNEILINWNYVGDEPDLLGCNLLRSEDYISFNQINDELITSNDDTFIYIDEDGIIVFHDYNNPTWTDVKKAVDECQLKYGWETINNVGTLIAFKVNSITQDEN